MQGRIPDGREYPDATFPPGVSEGNMPEYREPSGTARRQDSPPENLRDWQKNTWYGAAPVNVNPFDEPEDAPELREQRSDSLNNHSGVFWNQQTEGYQYTGSVKAVADSAEPQEKGKKKRKRRGFLYTVLILLSLAVIAVTVYFGVFNVREIRVMGNDRIPAEEIIRLSGLKKGMPIFSIRTEEVTRGIENNSYLQLKYVDKDLPGSVTICVKEREACCWMTWCGIFYTMDKQRVVLFETEEQGIRPAGLVKVDGLRIRSGCMVGQTLVLESEEQQNVFSNLFLEMKVLNCTELIEEADLSSLNSLLLTTRDGFTVSMGDATNLHAKLRSMLLTREELIRMGYQGGIINVINLENPVFTPEEQTGV